MSRVDVFQDINDVSDVAWAKKVSSIIHKFPAVTANFDDIADFNTQFKWRPFEGLYRYGMQTMAYPERPFS